MRRVSVAGVTRVKRMAASRRLALGVTHPQRVELWSDEGDERVKCGASGGWVRLTQAA